MIITIATLLLMMSLIGAGTYVAFTAYDAMSVRGAIIQNDMKGETARELIVRNMVYLSDEGLYAMPMGSTSSEGWTTLPNWLGTSFFSHSGRPYLYCPFNSFTGQGSASQVTMPTGSYSVGISQVAGRDYVVSSDYQKSGLMAAIVSPMGKKTKMPSCDDIVFSGGRYIVPGGQVWAITQTEVSLSSSMGENGEAALYLTPEATSGDDPFDADRGASQSLITNIERIRSGAISSNTIRMYFSGGDYVVNDPSSFTWNMAGLEDKTIILIGDESDIPRVFTSGGERISFHMPGATIRVENVDFDADALLERNEVTIRNSGFQSILGRGSHISMDQARIYNDEESSLTLTASKSIIKNSLDVNGGISLTRGSRMIADDASLTINSLSDKSKLSVFSGSEFILGGGSLSISNQAASSSAILIRDGLFTASGSNVLSTGSYSQVVDNRGGVIIDDSVMNLSGSSLIGFALSSGSSLKINSSDVFRSSVSPTLPSIAVDDSGAISISGTSAVMSAEFSCWDGPLFADSTPTNSAPELISLESVGNKSIWSCN